jgi:hypothetical protein
MLSDAVSFVLGTVARTVNGTIDRQTTSLNRIASLLTRN